MAASPAAPRRTTLLAFAGIVLFAGGNAVGIRYTNEEMAPFWGAAARFGAAALLFATLALLRRAEVPRGRALAAGVGYGVLGFGLAYALAYWALLSVGAGLAQVLLGLVPLLTLLLAAAQRIERLRLRGVLGTLLAVAGIAVVSSASANAGAPLLPIAALVLSALCIAQSAIVVKRAPRVDPAVMNAVGTGVGTVLLLAFSRMAQEPWTLPRQADTWVALAYLVLVGTFVVFLLFLYVLERWTASATSYLFVLAPFVTIVIAALLRGERLTLLHGVGGALALAGVVLGALWRGPAGRRPSHQAHV